MWKRWLTGVFVAVAILFAVAAVAVPHSSVFPTERVATATPIPPQPQGIVPTATPATRLEIFRQLISAKLEDSHREEYARYIEDDTVTWYTDEAGYFVPVKGELFRLLVHTDVRGNASG